jgi:EmrB/QacA subfamily drug resistance transporter
LGDRLGTKRVFLFALAMFTAASALCGQSRSLGELVGFRMLQGVGGGMLVPVGTAMLYRAFPPIERAKAATIPIVPTVLAPSLGPIIGAWLVTDVSWRWIFYVNLPVGAVTFVAGLLLLRDYRDQDAGRFDPGRVRPRLRRARVDPVRPVARPEHGWASPEVMATGILGVVLFAALIAVETRSRNPMLALRLYGEKMFRNITNVLGCMYAAFASVLFLLPLYLQNLRGLSPLQSGLTTFPKAVGVMLTGPLVGHLYHRVGPRQLIIGGLLGLTIMRAMLSLADLNTGLSLIRLVLFGRGVCTAFAAVPLQATLYTKISKADTGRASAIFATQRQVNGAVGIAALTTVLIERTLALNAGGQTGHAATLSSLGGFQAAFLGASVLVVVALLAFLAIRDSDAAASIRGRDKRRGWTLRHVYSRRSSSVSTVQEVIEQLQRIGMSGYEAKAYIALVAAGGPLNGYEVAKRSGVPRSTVYETLSKLVARAATFEVRGLTSGVEYLPLPPAALLGRTQEETEDAVGKLRKMLATVAVERTTHFTHSLAERQEALRRCQDLCVGAQNELLLLAWPDELGEMTQALRRAHSAGVNVNVLCFGETDEPVGRVQTHVMAPPKDVFESLGCRLLVLVADLEQVVIAGFVDDEAWGILTDDPAVVAVASEFVHFDMAVQVELALVEDQPEFAAMRREERVTEEQYNEHDPGVVADELVDAAGQLAATFESLDDAGWTGTGIYSWPSTQVRTVEWISQHTVHEAQHHLQDVDGLVTTGEG